MISDSAEFVIDKEYVLREAVNALTQNGIECWACNGTLLGIVRDGRLIEWDNDIDLGVYCQDKKRIIEVMGLFGYVLIDDGWHSDYVTFEKNKLRLDVNIFKIYGDYYASLWRVYRPGLMGKIFGFLASKLTRISFPGKNTVGRLVFTMKGYSYPVDLLEHFMDFPYRGYEIRIPEKFEIVLSSTYGEDWREPRRNYIWDLEAGNVMEK